MLQNTFVQSCKILQGCSIILHRGTRHQLIGAEEGETLQKPASAMLLRLLLLFLPQAYHQMPFDMRITPLVLDCQLPETFSAQCTSTFPSWSAKFA